MEIRLHDQVFICENEAAAVEQAFEQVFQILTDLNQQVSYFKINGEAVYADFDQYIETNLAEIKTIVVYTKTMQELLDDAVGSIQEYAVRAIPAIDKLVDEFYHEVKQETWNRFGQLVEGLQFIMDTINKVQEHQDWFEPAASLIAVKQKIAEKIVLLYSAMESQDRVWICDVLLYEIVPSLQALNTDRNSTSKHSH